MGNEWKKSLKSENYQNPVIIKLQEHKKAIAYILGIIALGTGIKLIDGKIKDDINNEKQTEIEGVFDSADIIKSDGERTYYIISSEANENDNKFTQWSNEVGEVLGISQEEYEQLVDYYKNPDYSLNEQIDNILKRISSNQVKYIDKEILNSKDAIIEYIKGLSNEEINPDLVDYIDNRLSEPLSDSDVCEIIRNHTSEVDLYRIDDSIYIKPRWIKGDIPTGQHSICHIEIEKFEEITGISWTEYSMCCEFVDDKSPTKEEFDRILEEQQGIDMYNDEQWNPEWDEQIDEMLGKENSQDGSR